MPRGRPRKDKAAPAAPATKPAKGNAAPLGIEAQLFLAADKLRKNLEPSDYKHVALGLIFLKHISIAFEARRAEDPTAAEDPDEYTAENVFWVPKEARWSHLQDSARQPAIGKTIDDAILFCYRHALEVALKAALPATGHGHSLPDLWNSLRPGLVGRMPPDQITWLGERIAEFMHVDPRSTAFRYQDAVPPGQDTELWVDFHHLKATMTRQLLVLAKIDGNLR